MKCLTPVVLGVRSQVTSSPKQPWYIPAGERRPMGRLSHPPRLKGKVQRRPLGHSPKGRGLSRGRAD